MVPNQSQTIGKAHSKAFYSTRIGKTSLAALLVLVAVGMVLMLRRFAVEAAMFGFVCLWLVSALLVYAAHVIQKQLRREGLSRGQRVGFVAFVVSCSILVGVLFEVLTVVGTPQASLLSFGSWSKTRIIVFSTLAFGSYVLVLGYRQRQQDENADEGMGHEDVSFIKRHGSFSVFGVALTLCLLAATLTGVWHWRYQAVRQRFAFLMLCVAVAVAMLVLVRRSLREHFEYAVLIVAVCLGTFLCLAEPRMTNVGTDDQIHLDNALGVSYVVSPTISESEQELMSTSWIDFNISNGAIISQYEDYSAAEGVINRLDADYKKAVEGDSPVHVVDGFAKPFTGTSYLAINVFGYIPSAFGLWIGRLFSLPLTLQLALGRLANMAFYSIIVANAVRIIPARKRLLGCIALFPTNLFLASNFSYDPWLNAWMMMGIAVTLREFTRKDELLTPLDVGRCFVPFLLALCVKAVYFPIVGILLLMPKERFSSRRSRVGYVVAVVGFALAIVALFALQMLLPSATAAADGDHRGGAEVSASGQIRYMLANPGAAAAAIANYLAGQVLSPTFVRGYAANYAYLVDNAVSHDALSSSYNFFRWLIPFGTLMFIGIFDQQDDALPLSLGGRFWTVICAVSGTVLSVIALYIVFTPVGADGVVGWQTRYVLPMLFPMLMVVEPRIKPRLQLMAVVCCTSMLALGAMLDASFVVVLP